MDTALTISNPSSNLFDTAKQAAAEVFSDSSIAFEEIKNRPWYKSLLNAITFQQGDKKMIVRNVRSLATLQSIFMEMYIKQLKEQDEELDHLMQQVLSTQQFAYKMYLSCVLQLKPQTDIGEMPEADQQILLLFLGEFNRTDCLSSAERENLQQYNRGISGGLCVSRPASDFLPEQLDKIQFPEVFYRCALEQCAVTDRLDPLNIPSNVLDAIQWLDISDRKKERTMTGVKAELNDYGAPYFFEKYRPAEPAFDESDLELAEDDEEAFEQEDAALEPPASAAGEGTGDEPPCPYQELVDVIRSRTEGGMLGQPLLNGRARTDKNKLIAQLLPDVLPVSKAVVEITKLSKDHLVFTTSALYWVSGEKVRKISYAELEPSYLGTKIIGEETAFVYAPPGEEQVTIRGLKAEALEQLLLEISGVDDYAESDVLTEFTSLPEDIQLGYMRILANIVRESGNPLHEAYRLSVRYGLQDDWEQISGELDLPMEDALAEYMGLIPYPNEEAVSIGLLKDICTVYQYTKDSDTLTIPEKKYFPLIFNGSSADRDAIIQYAQMEKQVIEKRIDAKGAQAISDAFSIAAGAVGASVLAYSGAMALFWSTLWFNFIPGIGTLISAAVIGGTVVSRILTQKTKKALSEAEMLQKMREEVLASYHKAEDAANEQGLAEVADGLQDEALKIADRIGIRYSGYTKAEQDLLQGIQYEIRTYLREDQKTCAQKKLSSNAKLVGDLLTKDWEKAIASFHYSSPKVSRDHVIGLYDPTFSGAVFGNFMGILFLKDGICYRKNKSTPTQWMSYFDMMAAEEKLTAIIVYGRNGDTITLNSINYSKLTGLLQKIVGMVKDKA